MSADPYSLDAYDFDLPEELIAQHPSAHRDESRLLVLDRKSGACSHGLFHDIVRYIRPGDVIVLNDARVIPARIRCLRETGGKVELLLAGKNPEGQWQAICNRSSRIRIGERIVAEADPSLEFTFTERRDNLFTVDPGKPLTDELLDVIGELPLPPYITRSGTDNDRDRYQTVYASSPGAVAAPTAGLHFTSRLLEEIKARGAVAVYCTLYVSWGTFQPVRTDDIAQHRMHQERYSLTEESARAINEARRQGRRIVAVGTTVVRVLESTLVRGENRPGAGSTDIFIHPPRSIASINALITNFHTPRSTLLMLVAAFAGHDTMMKAYECAVSMRYRFFSYGDAMLIL
jgi:S-adenosylmethionine:tRNA ribosyltransferase-isomerase